MSNLPDSELPLLLQEENTCAHIGFFDGVLSYVIPVRYLFRNNILLISPQITNNLTALKYSREVCLQIDGQTEYHGSYHISIWGSCREAERNNTEAATGFPFQIEIKYKKGVAEIKKDSSIRRLHLTGERLESRLATGA